MKMSFISLEEEDQNKISNLFLYFWNIYHLKPFWNIYHFTITMWSVCFFKLSVGILSCFRKQMQCLIFFYFCNFLLKERLRWNNIYEGYIIKNYVSIIVFTQITYNECM